MARGFVPTIKTSRRSRPRSLICSSRNRSKRRLRTAVDVLTSQNKERKLGWFTLRLKRLPTKNSTTVASEVAAKTWRASVLLRERRLDSYRPTKENRECQIRSRLANRKKFRTETRKDRNCASEVAPALCRLATAAARNEPTSSRAISTFQNQRCWYSHPLPMPGLDCSA